MVVVRALALTTTATIMKDKEGAAIAAPFIFF